MHPVVPKRGVDDDLAAMRPRSAYRRRASKPRENAAGQSKMRGHGVASVVTLDYA